MQIHLAMRYHICHMCHNDSKQVSMSDNTSILSTAEVARLLKCTDETVRRLIDAGTLPASRLWSKGNWRIKRDDVIAYAKLRNIELDL